MLGWATQAKEDCNGIANIRRGKVYHHGPEKALPKYPPGDFLRRPAKREGGILFETPLHLAFCIPKGIFTALRNQNA